MDIFYSETDTAFDEWDRSGKQTKARTCSAMCHETNESCSSTRGFASFPPGVLCYNPSKQLTTTQLLTLSLCPSEIEGELEG